MEYSMMVVILVGAVIVFLWLANIKLSRLIEINSSSNTIYSEAISNVIADGFSQQARYLGHLEQMKDLLEKINSKPVGGFVDGLEFELAGLRELIELKSSHIKNILQDTRYLYESGAPEDEYLRKFDEYPYGYSDHARRFGGYLDERIPVNERGDQEWW